MGLTPGVQFPKEALLHSVQSGSGAQPASYLIGTGGCFHTIREDQNAVERIVLDWSPQGTRKTKEDLEEVSCGRGTERRKDVEGGEVVGSGQK
jgi:hypothetical protein